LASPHEGNPMTDQTQTDAEKVKAAEAEARAKAVAEEKEKRAQAAAETKARKEAEMNRPLDETIPGGRYQVGGGWVNANGKPIDADGTLIED
jgi:uncharacterized protein YqfA (UPF0365 family)